MNVGYIGLGNMGGALAKRLQVSQSLIVHDRDEAAVQRMVEVGATASASVAELAERCEIILLCLPTSAQVRSVIFGDNGIASKAKPGTLIVDQTTGDPAATRAMAAELAQRGLELIDAPVSGGRSGATAGTIAMMIGATQAQFDRIEPILKLISPNLYHAGGVGAGHVVKLANNLLSAGQRLMSLEAVALAVKNGVDAGKVTEIMLAGAGQNYWLQKFMKSHIITGKLASGFTVGLFHKDIRLACQMANDSGVTLLFGNMAKEFAQLTINDMGSDAQVNAIALTMDRLAGTHVVPEGYTLD